MKWLQLARKHTLRSLGRYATYTVSQGLILAVVFLFQAIGTNPGLAEGFFSRASLTMGFGQVSVLMLVLGGLFAAYTNSFFFRRRAPELGLLSLLGLSKGAMVLWFLVEGALTALAALVIGAGLGLVLGPFSFLVLGALMDTTFPVAFVSGWEPFAAAAGAAALLLGLHVAGGLALLARSRLADLFQARRAPERPAPGHALLGLLGIALVVLSYGLASVTTLESIGVLSLPILVSNIAGTFLAVRHALAIGLEALRSRPLGTQDGVVLVALAQLSFRLKKNARMLALVTTLAATTVCAVGTAVYLYTVGGDSVTAQAPLDLQADRDDGPVFQELTALAARDPEAVRVDIDLLRVRGTLGDRAQTLLAVPASAARPWLELQGKTLPALGHGQTLLCWQPSPYEAEPRPRTVGLPGLSLTVVRQDLPAANWSSAGPLPLVVLTDADYGNLPLPGPGEKARQFVRLAGWKLPDPQVQDAAAQAVRVRFADTPNGDVSASSRYLVRHSAFATIGLILFVAAVIGLVLFLAGACILSFKQMMDLEDDAPRYRMLTHLGFDDAQVRRVLGIQLVLFFGIPVVLGIVHSIFALDLLGRIMGVPIGGHTLAVCLVYTALFGLALVLVLRAGLALVRRPLAAAE